MCKYEKKYLTCVNVYSIIFFAVSIGSQNVKKAEFPLSP